MRGGVVRFQTILPGCYDGRWPHMHFEVFAGPTAAVSGKDALLTAQIALPEAQISAFYAADARYAASVSNLSRTSLARDMVFSDNTDLQIAQQTLVLSGDGSGLKGTLTVAPAPQLTPITRLPPFGGRVRARRNKAPTR